MEQPFEQGFEPGTVSKRKRVFALSVRTAEGRRGGGEHSDTSGNGDLQEQSDTWLWAQLGLRGDKNTGQRGFSL